MGRVCAIGERGRVEGYGLAGADVAVAEDPAAVFEAWHLVPADAAVVILTPAAADVLGTPPSMPGRRCLVVVLP